MKNQQLPTHGGFIEITNEQFADLLGIQGSIANIIFNHETGVTTIAAAGTEEYFPPIDASGAVSELKPVWLREVKCDRALKLISDDNTTYIHKGGKK